jgi:hypothetical protein
VKASLSKEVVGVNAYIKKLGRSHIKKTLIIYLKDLENNIKKNQNQKKEKNN